MEYKGRKLTIGFLVGALVLTILYDIWVDKVFGVDATISRVINNWDDISPLFHTLFVFGIGFLMGHLLWSQKVGKNFIKEIIRLAGEVDLELYQNETVRPLIDKIREDKEKMGL